MYLDASQINRGQTLYRFLKAQPENYFEETTIRPCKSCHGTGLGGIHGELNDFSWDTYSYCNKCHGVGYVGLAGTIQIDDIHYICKNCEGVGCIQCVNGITDWVTHAMG